MYADQLEAQANRPIKDRLNGHSSSVSARRNPITGKRIGAKDLQLKLQRKSMGEATQCVRESVSVDVRDLGEKLSGMPYSNPVESKPPRQRPRSTNEASKPPWKSVIAQAHVPDINVATSIPKKKVQQKVDMTALKQMGDEYLKALGIPMGPRKKLLLALESRSNN